MGLITICVQTHVEIGHALAPAVQCRRFGKHGSLRDEVVHGLAARRCSPWRFRGRSGCCRVSSLLVRLLPPLLLRLLMLRLRLPPLLLVCLVLHLLPRLLPLEGLFLQVVLACKKAVAT